MFKGPGKIVRYNKSSSYPVFELTGVNCIFGFSPDSLVPFQYFQWQLNLGNLSYINVLQWFSVFRVCSSDKIFSPSL